MIDKTEVNYMNGNEANKKIIECVILTIIMSMTIVFSLYFFPILILILPAPFIIYGIKHDLISSITSLIISFVIVSIFTSIGISLSYLLLLGPVIIINIYHIKRRVSPNKVILYSAVAFFTSNLILFALQSLSGANLILELKEGFRQTLAAQMEIFKEMGLTSYELLERREAIKSQYQTLLLIIPSMMLLTSVIISSIYYRLTVHGLRKIGIGILNIPRFSKFSLPDNFVAGSLFMLISAFIISWLDIPLATPIYVNIIVLLVFVLFIQGLSVIDHLLNKIRMKRFIKIISYFIIFLTPQIYNLISILGGIDVLLDLRKIRGSKSI